MISDEALLALEEQFIEASSSGNGDFYRDNLVEDALLVLPAMGVLTKDRCVEEVERNRVSWAHFRLEESRIVRLTDGSAIVTSKLTGLLEGEENLFSMLMSSAYVDRDGSWKLAFHHQTPLGEI